MKVAFLYDPGCLDGTRGGAELVMDELIEAAPDSVEFTTAEDAETVVIGNCVKLDHEKILPQIEGKKVWRYHHDLARDESPVLREWLDANAEHIFTSPLHKELYGHRTDAHLIPPSANLADFRPPREQRRHPKRKGIVTVASWQGPGKGAQLVSETVYQQDETLDCYGTGQFRPIGKHVRDMGPVRHADLPAILWQYEQFVFLPFAPEPFCRCVAEAWAAGCEILTNDLVGAKWWIENDPDALYTAAEDFWSLIND
jgi:glycosyltransferase involved in cell wall biosynthesis